VFFVSASRSRLPNCGVNQTVMAGKGTGVGRRGETKNGRRKRRERHKNKKKSEIDRITGEALSHAFYGEGHRTVESVIKERRLNEILTTNYHYLEKEGVEEKKET